MLAIGSLRSLMDKHLVDGWTLDWGVAWLFNGRGGSWTFAREEGRGVCMDAGVWWLEWDGRDGTYLRRPWPFTYKHTLTHKWWGHLPIIIHQTDSNETPHTNSSPQHLLQIPSLRRSSLVFCPQVLLGRLHFHLPYSPSSLLRYIFLGWGMCFLGFEVDWPKCGRLNRIFV